MVEKDNLIFHSQRRKDFIDFLISMKNLSYYLFISINSYSSLRMHTRRRKKLSLMKEDENLIKELRKSFISQGRGLEKV